MGDPGRDGPMIRAPRRDARAARPILGPVKLVVAIVSPEDAGPLVEARPGGGGGGAPRPPPPPVLLAAVLLLVHQYPSIWFGK
jgi:hypothetical protein